MNSVVQIFKKSNHYELLIRYMKYRKIYDKNTSINKNNSNAKKKNSKNISIQNEVGNRPAFNRYKMAVSTLATQHYFSFIYSKTLKINQNLPFCNVKSSKTL